MIFEVTIKTKEWETKFNAYSPKEVIKKAANAVGLNLEIVKQEKI